MAEHGEVQSWQLKWTEALWHSVSVFCAINSINKLHWAQIFLWRDLCISLDLETSGPGLLFLDIQPHFARDLPLSSLQLLLMPKCGLWQDGPPDGSSYGSLPKDQLTPITAEKTRCEIKHRILIVCLWQAVTRVLFCVFGLVRMLTKSRLLTQMWRQKLQPEFRLRKCP